MPELPEVETMASDLRGALIGRKIKTVRILVPKMVKYPAPAKFAARLRGAKILDVARRAKYLRFHLSGGRELVVHPKMTGHFLLINKELKNFRNKKIKELENKPESLKYTRAKFILDNGGELCFSDIRKFGTLRLLDKKQAEDFFNELGPEPLGKSFKVGKFISLISLQNRKIKQVLMDPAVIAGIGNIYSDEALYAAGIHPEKRASEIQVYELKKLYFEIIKILKKAIRLRGSSINNYRDTRGERGSYQDARMIYGRKNEQCGRCGSVIQKIIVAGRSACFCPKCQRSH